MGIKGNSVSFPNYSQQRLKENCLISNYRKFSPSQKSYSIPEVVNTPEDYTPIKRFFSWAEDSSDVIIKNDQT